LVILNYRSIIPLSSYGNKIELSKYKDTITVTTSILIKQLLAKLTYASGIADRKLRRFKEHNCSLILMYHRVIPAPDRTIQPGMLVTPSTFDSHLKLLKKKFNVVPLHSIRSRTDDSKSDKPYCAITFDDGWKDFYDFAWPLLAKHQLPATVFLPTNFIGTNKMFWTDEFAYLLDQRQKTSFKYLSDVGLHDTLQKIDILPGPYNIRLEKGIEFLKAFPLKKIQRILCGLSEIWQTNVNVTQRQFMTWEEVIELKETGLISFGSHTVNHQILTTLNEEEIKAEIHDSLQVLIKKQIADNSTFSFCYPNGNYSAEIANLVNQAGHDIAVTTKKGWNRIDEERYTLKRIGIHEDMTSTPALFMNRIVELI
jgi:peptidoglycan/xylan/chitin deacetylase (PgdA/CDA1 family)